MSTGMNKVNIYLKKFLPQQHITNNFLEYLRTLTTDVMADIFPEEGVFYGGDFSADGSDRFRISTPLLATDGLGHRIVLNPDEAQQIQFENENGSTYHVGLKYEEIPEGTEVNVRTGEIEYVFDQERIGLKGQPNSVTDNGATISFVVDSVTEAGVSNAGRKVRVWMKTAIGQADAFFEGVITWDGSNNILTTTHLLGQEAGSVSTNASDYEAFLVGPVVKKGTNLDADPEIVYLGNITGAGAGNPPSTFDHSGRNLLFSGGSVSVLTDEVKGFLVGGGLITWDLSSETLSWAEDIKFIMPHQSFTYILQAQSIAGFADGEVAYFQADSSDGVKSLTKVTYGSVPNDTKNIITILRYGNNIYFKDGALELKGDASGDTSGRINDITEDLLTFMGATDESDSDPNYPSAEIVTQGSSLTTAIGALDNEVNAIVENNPGEQIFTATAGQSVFNLTQFQVDPDNTVYDVEVFVDGRRQTLDPAGTLTRGFRKNSLTQIELSEALPEGKEVVVWKQGTSYGGTSAPSAGNLWSDPMDASQIPNVDAVHDVGSDSRRIREGHFETSYSGKVVQKTNVGNVAKIKTMESGHPASMSAGTPIAKSTDGKIYPADSDNSPGKKYIGILLQPLNFGESGRVLCAGENVPGILTGLGFQPGDEIYVGETAGTYTNDPSTFSGLDDDIIRVGIADCADGVVSNMATDLIMVTDIVARA